jgi:RNA polymerase sigma-70 factor (ECF subfamily)
VPGQSHDDSFGAVVLPHLDAAFALARWLVRDRAAAEDVVQDAIVRALTYFSTYKGVNPRAWLLQIVRNAAHAANRVDPGSVHLALDDAAAETALADSGDNPETALLKARGDRRVRELIAALPVELREPLVLREFEELSYKEIAAVTQTPIGTVMSRLFRARQLLVRAAGEEAK